MGRILRWGLLQLCQSLVKGLYKLLNTAEKLKYNNRKKSLIQLVQLIYDTGIQ